jgi:ABC-type branched-subunit amino acid transport system substrate-binding protein
MPSRLVDALGVAFVVAAGLSARASMPEDSLTSQERRGRDLYVGSSRDAVTAQIGGARAEAPAAALACAACHGADGRGTREGNVVASNITWDRLTAAFGAAQPGRRRHPPYTEASFSRAIGAGIDPAGQPLHPAMPRFELPVGDVTALVSYLKRLGTDQASGVTDRVIRVGTLVPADGPDADAGRAAAAALSAYFDRLNAGGGVYGRRVELSVASLGAGTRDAAPIVDGLIRDASPLALVAGIAGGGLDATAIAAAEARRVPFIGPLTRIATPSATARTTFYLLSGVEQQARTLIDFEAARSGAGDTTVALARSRALVPDDVAGRIAAACGEKGWHVRQLIVDGDDVGPQDVAGELTRTAAGRVLFLTDGRTTARLIDLTAAAHPASTFLVPGALATDDVLRVSASAMPRTFVAVPSVPADQSPAAREEYRTLARDYQLSPADVAAQLAAIGAAKVLIQGLKVAGRGLDRTTLVAAIETLNDFDTGLTPRLRFGRSTRVGAAGAYIATPDLEQKQLRQVTDWLPVR